MDGCPDGQKDRLMYRWLDRKRDKIRLDWTI